MKRQKRVIGTGWAAALLLLSCPASADLIDDHLRVRTFIAAGTGSLLVIPIEGNGLVDTGDQELVNGPYSGNGRARAEQDGAVLRSRSASATTGAGNASFASTRMSVARMDVLEVTGDGAPPTIRFTFAVHATLTAANTTIGGITPDVSQAAVAVGAFLNILNFPTLPLPPNGIHATVESIGGDPVSTIVSSGWDSSSFTQTGASTYEFNGTFSLLSNRLTGPGLEDGAYFMSAAFDTYANNRGIASNADGYDSMTLLSITLPDGSPLPGGPDLSYQFESGAPIEPDDDLDGIGNDADNCVLVANPDQNDTNADGYGNICDPDLDNNGVVNFGDVALWVPFFNTACGNVDEDFNGDDFCNFGDFSLFPEFFLNPPGPSGISP